MESESSLNKARYEAAVKKASTKTKEDMYMLLEFNSGNKLILPYKQGSQIIELLQDSMVFQEYWSEPPRFKNLDDEIIFKPMSGEEVTIIKVAKLLGVPLNEAKKMKEAQP